MADSGSDSPNWIVDILAALPPQLQGAAVVVAAGVVGYLLFQKFSRQMHGDGPKATDVVIGGPTTFADLEPVKQLAANVERLTMQMMKSAVSTDGMTAGVATAVGQMATMTAKMGELCDLVGQHLVDLREEREAEKDEAIEQRGFERGLAERKPVRRVRRKPAPKG